MHTYFKEFVQAFGSLINQDIPSPMVVFLSGQTHHSHFINKCVCSYDVILHLWIFSGFAYSPCGFSCTWQTYDHYHLEGIGNDFSFIWYELTAHNLCSPIYPKGNILAKATIFIFNIFVKNSIIVQFVFSFTDTLSQGKFRNYITSHVHTI